MGLGLVMDRPRSSHGDGSGFSSSFCPGAGAKCSPCTMNQLISQSKQALSKNV